MQIAQKTFYRGMGVWFAFILLTAMTTVMISSCSTIGYENVDTTRKAILIATAETRAANLLLQDLIQRNIIDDNSAREVLSALRASMASLQTGLNALDTGGDPLTAESTLARANSSLNIALIMLSNFTGEP